MATRLPAHIRATLIASMATVLGGAACSVQRPPAARFPDTNVIAFTHVTVIDVRSGEAVRDQNVVISGQRIVAAGPAGSVRVPAGARIVDGRGRFLIPGLWDMHVHLGRTGPSSLAVYVANGITGVRDMGGRFEQVKAWRDSILGGTLVGPRILLAGPIVESSEWLASMRAGALSRGEPGAEGLHADRIGLATPADARQAVDSIAGLGADFIKMRTYPAPDAVAALLRAADDRGLPVAAHLPLPVTPAALAALQFASIEHGYVGFVSGRITSALDELPDSARRATFRALARRGVAYTPTLIAAKASRLTPDSVIRAIALDTTGRTDPRRILLEPALVRDWLRDVASRADETPIDWAKLYGSWARDLVLAREEGVLLLAGSDPGTPMVYPGFALHDELVAMVEDAGLAPIDALRAATLNAARFVNAADSLGVIEAGGAADLVLLNADPLVDVRHTASIRGVMARGRYFDRSALDSLMAEAARTARTRY